eukprot:CAMPEP_0202905122 /NCGR_PEP_ID=MMETSP1392-20130828/32648_1 /ASSEMBLY_ACC=CAM_ASM_000868 /TAXON_ID=225041 /ORGANISM="Chlamydomonas chlamydogama, Strain SAG 11-48b" /LENGTH=77 /DNA_ID=CAMNT_0049593073 /DNA_START=173 /DNA_END=407 /DNA_ORIENTATION=+
MTAMDQCHTQCSALVVALPAAISRHMEPVVGVLRLGHDPVHVVQLGGAGVRAVHVPHQGHYAPADDTLKRPALVEDD